MANTGLPIRQSHREGLIMHSDRGAVMRGHDGLQLLSIERSARTCCARVGTVTNRRRTGIYILTCGALAWLYSFSGIAS